MSSCVCAFNNDSGEYCDKWNESYFRARRALKCSECGHSIFPGEDYQKVVNSYQGEISKVRTCAWCMDLIQTLKDFSPCYMQIVFGLTEDISFIQDELRDLVQSQRMSKGAAIWVLRKIVRIKNAKFRNGTFPVIRRR